MTTASSNAAQSQPADVLSVSSLKVGYGDLTAIWDVSLNAAKGQIQAVVGRNGAGKSTLLAGIAGLLPAMSGTVHLLGTDVTTWPAHRRVRHGLGLVRGKQVFRGLTVRENLILGGYGGKSSRAAKTAAIDEVLERFPVLIGRFGEPAGALSGGQQQILAIAQALVARPAVLLVDEPSSGLAPIMVEEVHGALTRLASDGYAVVLVEEQIDDALSGIAERVMVVEEGRLAMTATPNAIDRQALDSLMEPETALGNSV